MTLLGRASTDETAAALLERLLPQLEHVIAELPADVDLLSALSNTIPRPTLALAEADLAVTRRILGLLPADRIDEQAYWLTRLGEALSNTDRLTEALPVRRNPFGSGAGWLRLIPTCSLSTSPTP